MKKVLVFGTFDVFHEGHKDFFRQALNYGDELFVVVARDETVLKVKGLLPVNFEQNRLKEIQKSDLVEDVFLGSLGDKYAVIEEIKPDIVCLGYDQNSFDKNLRSELDNRGFGNVKIKRVEAYKPEVYKSSKILNKK